MNVTPIFAASEPVGASLQFQSNPPRRILVVDDDPYVRHLSAEVLIQHGFEVNAAADALAGWEELQVNNYNLLIIENDLPKLTGAGLVRKLRAARMAVPVVMTAGRLPARQLARNQSLQLAATLLKPFAVDALLDTVKIVLQTTGTAHGLIVPPPDLRKPSQPDRGLKLMAAPAIATTQVIQEIRKRFTAYSHWGLNE
jgi:DNA-binding response OmpR family regulator